MSEWDAKAGAIVISDERGEDSNAQTEQFFASLTASGLDLNAAFVQQQTALKDARKRHHAIHHGLADLVSAGSLLDAALTSLLQRMQDYEGRVAAVHALVDVDMDASTLKGWRSAVMSRLNGSAASVAGWVPTYTSLRDAKPLSPSTSSGA